MIIKSLEDLKKIKEEHRKNVSLRINEDAAEDGIEILVGMSTCGIAAGSREVLNAFVEEIAKEGMEKVKVITVGCLGHCHSEPLVQVNIAKQKPVLYRKVKVKDVPEIIEKHIKGGKPIKEMMLDIDVVRP